MSATIALVGNPNVGKSTLFNHVTGSRQRTVNAPGTTVHLMAGTWKSLDATVLDLPGTYSLIARSPDEQVVTDTLGGRPWGSSSAGHSGALNISFSLSHSGEARDPGADPHIDLVLAVLDGGSLTRSLYLLAQIGQTGYPVAALITMTDVAKADGHPVDIERLSAATGIPMLAFDPRNAAGYAALDDMVREALANPPRLAGLEPDPSAPGYPSAPVTTGIETASTQAAPAEAAAPADSSALAAAGGDLNRASTLFAWVDAVEKSATDAETSSSDKPSYSDRIDRVLLHPVAGTIVFVALLFVLFKAAGEWLGPVQDFFDGLFASTDPGAFSLANSFQWALDRAGAGDSWLASLLVNGLATGLGVVASFFPLMFLIYLALTVLEDSGYMARAAFLGDRLMRKIGLDGRVILPLIMGFGCNLPSLAAARALPSERQRLITVLITPYTSCAARLTIYLMIAKIFFPRHTALVVLAMYLISSAIIVVSAWGLSRLFGNAEQERPLMLVLPAYQVPQVVHLLAMTWRRAWSFITGAGKIIVVMTLVVWLLSAIPVGASAIETSNGTTRAASFADPELPMEESLYGRIAQTVEPLFIPTGFGEWHMMGALMTGFVAKETVVSSIVTSYNLEAEAAGDAEDNGDDLGMLPELLHDSFTKSAGEGYQGLAAFAFMVFVLAYTPCMATVAEQAKLIGGRKASIMVLTQFVLAGALAVTIFQGGKLLL